MRASYNFYYILCAADRYADYYKRLLEVNMGIKPNIPPKRRTFVLKKCARCNQEYGPDDFAPTKSFFFPDQVLPICNNCIKEILISEDFNWAMVDKICQMADIPFVPREFERLHDANGDDVFPVYARVFQGQEYESIGWDDYFKEFKTLKETRLIEDELPLIGDEKIQKLRAKWEITMTPISLYIQKTFIMVCWLHRILMAPSRLNRLNSYV